MTDKKNRDQQPSETATEEKPGDAEDAQVESERKTQTSGKKPQPKKAKDEAEPVDEDEEENDKTDGEANQEQDEDHDSEDDQLSSLRNLKKRLEEEEKRITEKRRQLETAARAKRKRSEERTRLAGAPVINFHGVDSNAAATIAQALLGKGDNSGGSATGAAPVDSPGGQKQLTKSANESASSDENQATEKKEQPSMSESANSAGASADFDASQLEQFNQFMKFQEQQKKAAEERAKAEAEAAKKKEADAEREKIFAEARAKAEAEAKAKYEAMLAQNSGKEQTSEQKAEIERKEQESNAAMSKAEQAAPSSFDIEAFKAQIAAEVKKEVLAASQQKQSQKRDAAAMETDDPDADVDDKVPGNKAEETNTEEEDKYALNNVDQSEVDDAIAQIKQRRSKLEETKRKFGAIAAELPERKRSEYEQQIQTEEAAISGACTELVRRAFATQRAFTKNNGKPVSERIRNTYTSLATKGVLADSDLDYIGTQMEVITQSNAASVANQRALEERERQFQKDRQELMRAALLKDEELDRMKAFGDVMKTDPFGQRQQYEPPVAHSMASVATSSAPAHKSMPGNGPGETLGSASGPPDMIKNSYAKKTGINWKPVNPDDPANPPPQREGVFRQARPGSAIPPHQDVNGRRVALRPVRALRGWQTKDMDPQMLEAFNRARAECDPVTGNFSTMRAQDLLIDKNKLNGFSTLHEGTHRGDMGAIVLNDGLPINFGPTKIPN